MAIPIPHIHHHTTTPPPPQQQQRCVEQWSVQRTAGQFHAVANELFRQCHEIHRTNDVPIGDDGKNTDDHILRRLPTWTRRPTIVEVDQSLSIVDSILRSWIIPHLCVNTRALKQLVGLQNNNDNIVNNNSNNNKRTSVSVGMASFQSLLRHVHCTNPLAIHNPITTTVPNHITSDVYECNPYFIPESNNVPVLVLVVSYPYVVRSRRCSCLEYCSSRFLGG